MKPKLMALKIDLKSAVPVYEQIMAFIKRLILGGELLKNEKLTPVKEMALRLRVNPNTIAKVYFRLEVEGFVYSKPGRGYFVNVDPEKHREEKKTLFRKAALEFINTSRQLGYLPEDIKKEIDMCLRTPSDGNKED